MLVKTRNRGGWSKASLAYLEQVQQVLTDLSDYWPLTLRQAYYQLVAAVIIENNRNQYAKLSRILTKARLDGRVGWDAIQDRSRSELPSGGWDDREHFASDELAGFLTGYRRDLLQTQDVALELWVEKDALSRICHRVAQPYCVPVTVARGFSSVSYVHNCRERIERNTREGKQTVVLYFGDLDPSGWEMLPSMMTTLRDEMGLGDDVVDKRCALTLEQVQKYNLPHDPTAIKATDPRFKKYVAQFGHLAVELDALPPATLESIIRVSIEAQLNMNAFKAEREQEAEEREHLNETKQRVCVLLDDDIG